MGHDGLQVRHSALLGAGRSRLFVIALVLAAGVGGYLVSAAVVRSDRRTTAEQGAQLDSGRAQILLQRASSYVSGMAEQLAVQPVAGEREFSFVAGTMSSTFGLVDALWITRGATPTVRYATTIGTGVSVSRWPALASWLRGRQVLFGVAATRLSNFGGQPGFFVVSSARFGGGADGVGYLAVFVPRGWLALSLSERPSQIEITLGGRVLEGRLRSRPVEAPRFQALDQSFQIGHPLAPATTLESWLPWIALAWPMLVALVALLVGGLVAGRRRAERTVERIFELSPDMLCVAGYDGFFKRVNPAFEDTLGYSRGELIQKPFREFVHPADRAVTDAALAQLVGGETVVSFQNRYLAEDGSARWLEWNARPAPREGVIYAAARDVTERHEAEEEVRLAQAALEASRDALQELADDQAALRRVATLVARGAPPVEVFTTVAAEARGRLRAQLAILCRFESESELVVLAIDTETTSHVEVGRATPVERNGVSGQILRTGRPTGLLDVAAMTGVSGDGLRQMNMRSVAGSPVIVEGKLWGALCFAWGEGRPQLSNLAARMTSFTDLAATAIANAYSRAELAASRARLVVAADETRRRIERDLHDGTQQRLVSIALSLRAAAAQIPEDLVEVRARFSEVERGLSAALDELQEISRGIHPAILTRGGLQPALRALARRTMVPTEVELELPERLPAQIEVALYYVVSEAITNASKHSGAEVVTVRVALRGEVVEAMVRDDGVGGADAERGSGLLGMRDRVETLRGSFSVESVPGQGTTVHASIPLDSALVTSVREQDVMVKGDGDQPSQIRR
jgi:PAS domain S-box-containing protein